MFRVLPVVLLIVTALPSVSLGQSCEGSPSWAFRRSTYSHAPETGGRVAQFQRIEPVEGLDDPRQYTSGYRRTRTTLRGADGSVDATYQVQSWGNGRGGPDAEWERFHDAWLQSAISGGSYYATPGYGYGGAYGYGPGHASGFGYGSGPGGFWTGYGHGYPAPYGFPGPYGTGYRGYIAPHSPWNPLHPGPYHP